MASIFTGYKPPMFVEISLPILVIAIYLRMVNRNLNLFKKVSIDFLTGVQSREFFLQSLTEMINSKTPFHLINVDLNGFKKVNDTFGHPTGDQYLIEIAFRLKQSLRKEDVVARMGGDEFGIIIPGEMSNRDLSQLLKRTVNKLVSTYFEFEDAKIPISLAIGAASFPRDSLDVEDLLRKADAAMYISKNEKLDYFIFDHKKYCNPYDDLKILSDLRSALTNNELTVVYQPKFSLETNKIVGCEALSRWKSKSMGEISPDKFIKMAEKEGLINLLLQNLLIKVFEDINMWKESGVDLNHIGINVSAENLSSMQIISEIMMTAKSYSIDLSKIMLEVTETAIMKDPEESIKYLVMLNSLGVNLSIDDFGTGNSSFIYLKHLPITEIKIDKTFIKDMIKGNTDLMIVVSTIKLAKSCGIKVVAEGVESVEQLNMLRDHECDSVQGYLISKPLSSLEFLKLVKEQNEK
jgi:diguanylate cyclase (GGDEF)-like protein